MAHFFKKNALGQECRSETKYSNRDLNPQDLNLTVVGQTWAAIVPKTNYLPCSVTRFGDLLDFGQLFKAFGYN